MFRLILAVQIYSAGIAFIWLLPLMTVNVLAIIPSLKRNKPAR